VEWESWTSSRDNVDSDNFHTTGIDKEYIAVGLVVLDVLDGGTSEYNRKEKYSFHDGSDVDL
jgi:hypothetical protein